MSDWKVVRLGELAESVDYGVTASANTQPVGPKFLRITDIQDGKVDWSAVPFCEADERSLNSSRLRAGDIVFARTGATTGKSFLIRECPQDAVFASYLIRVRPGPAVDPVYLSQFFKSQNYWAQITSGARGAAQPGVNATTLQGLKIPLPGLDEQKRIAVILDQAESLRAKRRAALEQLDALTQAIFIEMFGNEQGEFFELGQKLSFITSGGRGWAKYYSESGARFIRSLDVQMNFIGGDDAAYVQAPENAEARRTRVQENDVLLTITGSCIGRVAPVSREFDGAYISQHVAILRADRNEVDPIFLSYYLSLSSGGQRQIERSQYGQTKPGLNFEQIRAFRIPDAPIEEQREFSQRLAVIEMQRVKFRRQLSELDALFASLQHRAFRGEL